MRRDDSSRSLRREPGRPVAEDIAERLERHIERSACGRVSDFHADLADGALILRGHCRTYYAKQLVLQAALDMAEGVIALTNLIEVK